MVVEPLDYHRVLAAAAGEFAVVVGADAHLFTEARPAQTTLTNALQAEGAEIGTLYRTWTSVRIDYRPPAAGEGGLVSETFEIYDDGQDQPGFGAWTYVESLHFGDILIPAATAPTAATTRATAHAQAVGAGSPTTAPAPAAAPTGTTTAETTAVEKRPSSASRRTQHDVAVMTETARPAKLGHGATAGYVLSPQALGGVNHGNQWNGDPAPRAKIDSNPKAKHIDIQTHIFTRL